MSTQIHPAHAPTRFSVVVSAHNEEGVIGRLLEAVLVDAEPGDVHVVVACNGCTDGTAAVARSFGPSVTVLELPVASKRPAQRAGDAAAHGYPRAYVDADVVITLADLQRLARPLERAQVLATAPERRLVAAGRSWVVARYYQVWQRLPEVREGLFGRGVIMVSRDGAERVAALPTLMSDDLAMSEAFRPHERQVVSEATVRIQLPRTVRDLVRRRVRVATGNAQADQLGVRGAGRSTSILVLVRIAAESPSRILDVLIFLWIAVVARGIAWRRVRAGDFTTWLRDESSRLPASDCVENGGESSGVR